MDSTSIQVRTQPRSFKTRADWTRGPRLGRPPPRGILRLSAGTPPRRRSRRGQIRRWSGGTALAFLDRTLADEAGGTATRLPTTSLATHSLRRRARVRDKRAKPTHGVARRTDRGMPTVLGATKRGRRFYSRMLDRQNTDPFTAAFLSRCIGRTTTARRICWLCVLLLERSGAMESERGLLSRATQGVSRGKIGIAFVGNRRIELPGASSSVR